MRILFLGNPKFYPWYKAAIESAGHKMVGMNDSPDLGIIAYYGKIIPKHELEIPKHGFINIHPSLLPKYRGPSPVRSAILAGDEITGVTIHITISKIDAGPIIAQKEFQIDPKDTYESLEEKLMRAGAEMLPDAIENWISGNVAPREQNEPDATYTKIFKTEDGHIDWAKTPGEIINLIRALSPDPGVFTIWNGKRLLILKADPEKSSHDFQHGKAIKTNDGFKIACRGGFIKPLLIKLEGKKEIAPDAFLHGHRDIIGTILTQ